MAKIKTKISVKEVKEHVLATDELRWAREEAVNMTTRLFAETPFKNLIGATTVQSEATAVSDVPFYQTILEIYGFLKTGEFEGLNKFIASKQKAA